MILLQETGRKRNLNSPQYFQVLAHAQTFFRGVVSCIAVNILIFFVLIVMDSSAGCSDNNANVKGEAKSYKYKVCATLFSLCLYLFVGIFYVVIKS